MRMKFSTLQKLTVDLARLPSTVSRDKPGNLPARKDQDEDKDMQGRGDRQNLDQPRGGSDAVDEPGGHEPEVTPSVNSDSVIGSTAVTPGAKCPSIATSATSASPEKSMVS